MFLLCPFIPWVWPGCPGVTSSPVNGIPGILILTTSYSFDHCLLVMSRLGISVDRFLTLRLTRLNIPSNVRSTPSLNGGSQGVTSLLFFKNSKGGAEYCICGAYFAIAICFNFIVSADIPDKIVIKSSFPLRTRPPGMFTEMSKDASSPKKKRQRKKKKSGRKRRMKRNQMEIEYFRIGQDGIEQNGIRSTRNYK